MVLVLFFLFFFSSRRRHTRCSRDWSSDVCSSDLLAPTESAEVDTPGLRLHCSPASWRIVATNLLSRTAEGTKPIETAPPPSEVATEKPAPINFVISIDGEEHPIQVNNPIVLKMGGRDRKIILRSAP